MIINKNIYPFVVLSEESLSTALIRIDQNRHKLIYVVDHNNILLGCLTDGDLRRWMLEQKKVDLNLPVLSAINKKCLFLLEDEDFEIIESSFDERVNSIPLVDSFGRITSIAEATSNQFFIENRKISNNDSVFIIAEIGNNHQGSLELAKKLIDAAASANADCVKFQLRKLDKIYSKVSNELDSTQDLGTEYTLNLLNKYQLSDDDLFAAFDYAKEKKIIPLCSPWDEDSAQKLESYGFDAYKVASADFTNYPLLQKLSRTGKYPRACPYHIFVVPISRIDLSKRCVRPVCVRILVRQTCCAGSGDPQGSTVVETGYSCQRECLSLA